MKATRKAFVSHRIDANKAGTGAWSRGWKHSETWTMSCFASGRDDLDDGGFGDRKGLFSHAWSNDTIRSTLSLPTLTVCWDQC